MGQEDIRWQEDGSGIDPVMYLQSQGARTSGAGKSTSHGGPKCSWKRNKFPEECIQEGFLPPQNVDETRSYNNINIFHTGSLIKVVSLNERPQFFLIRNTADLVPCNFDFNIC
jgi:hypothetical protein